MKKIVDWLSEHRIFGFRSKTPWKMMVATIGYLFLLLFAFSSPEAFALVVIVVFAIAVYADSLSIRSRMLEIPFIQKMPGFRSGNKNKMTIAIVGYGFILLVIVSAIFAPPIPTPTPTPVIPTPTPTPHYEGRSVFSGAFSAKPNKLHYKEFQVTVDLDHPSKIIFSVEALHNEAQFNWYVMNCDATTLEEEERAGTGYTHIVEMDHAFSNRVDGKVTITESGTYLFVVVQTNDFIGVQDIWVDVVVEEWVKAS